MASVTHQALLMASSGTVAAVPKGWQPPLSTVAPSVARDRFGPMRAAAYANHWLSPPATVVTTVNFGWSQPLLVAAPVANTTRADASSWDHGWLPAIARDPFWTSVVLLMSFDDVNGSTGAPGFTDFSPAAHGTAGTSFIGTGAISTAQSVFGGSSVRLNGGGQRFQYSDSADWNLSNGLFTIEYRFRPVSVALAFHIDQWSNFAGDLGWVLYADTTYKMNVSTTGSNNLNDVTSAALFSVNTWYAAAMDFDGTKYRAYINGTMVASSITLRTIFNSTQLLTIGAGALGAFSFNGYIDELRVTKGVARYASDGGYAVATAPFPRA